MPDFNSEQFQSSLADTIAWCKMKAIGMNADADDIRQRQALYAQAEQHWEEAQETVKMRMATSKDHRNQTMAERDGTLETDSGFPWTYGP